MRNSSIMTHFSDEARVFVLTLYLYTTIFIPLYYTATLLFFCKIVVGYFTALLQYYIQKSVGNSICLLFYRKLLKGREMT